MAALPPIPEPEPLPSGDTRFVRMITICAIMTLR